MEGVQSLRGIPDVLPPLSVRWQRMHRALVEVVEAHGYQPMILPLLEPLALFQRSIGESTDIVQKEMYTIPPKRQGKETVALRPEGTAGCARAVDQHGLAFDRTCRLWYSGPMYRYERPQRGRQRQFHQFGVEAFGFDGVAIEAELLCLCASLFDHIGAGDGVLLELNSLGGAASRKAYCETLVTFLREHRGELDGDSLARLDTNPLRILDSKNEGVRELLEEAPLLSDYLTPEDRDAFERLCRLLDRAGMAWRHNPHLVRGLDYYNGLVFEWVSEHVGAQSTLCAGGRYDGLMQQIGGRSTPGCGFAFGMERLLLHLDTVRGGDEAAESQAQAMRLYVVADSEATAEAVLLAHRLRGQLCRQYPQLQIISHCVDNSFKTQFKHADRSGAAWALVLGQRELVSNTVQLHPLRGQGSPREVGRDTLLAELRTIFFEQ